MNPTSPRRSPLAWVLSGLVRLYQATAPLRSPRCRYYPSCSSYALEALRVHGGLRGSWLAARRLGRCHPWSPGGVDHVPPARPTRAARLGGVDVRAASDSGLSGSVRRPGSTPGPFTAPGASSPGASRK